MVIVSSSVVTSLSSNNTASKIGEKKIDKVDDSNDGLNDAMPVVSNITRSRRQLHHQIKTLPRHPRQIFHQETPFTRGNGFISFGGLPPVARSSSSRVVLPPVTLPTVHGSSIMIQETKTKLLDSSSVRVDLQSDQFRHQHRIEDGKGNFQFFQIGKSERPKTQSLNQIYNKPTFFPTPITKPQTHEQSNFARESATLISSSSSLSPTISSLFSTSFTVTPPPVSPSASSSTTPEPRQPKALSFGPTPSTFLNSNTAKLTNPSTVQPTLFSPTAIPVRGLPPMQRSQAEQSVAFSPFLNTNRFGFSPLQFPKSAPVTMTAPRSPSFFNPFSSPPQQNQFASPNSNLFLPPLNQQRIPVPKQFMPQPFQPRPLVPKQFMPILMTPTMKTRHLAEPRVIATSRPLIAQARVPEKDRSKAPLISFNELQTLQSLSTTTARPRQTTTITTRTTSSRPTTTTLRSTTSTSSTTRISRLLAKTTSFQQPNVFSNFQIFAATMRPNPVQHSEVPSPTGQFTVFPSRGEAVAPIPSNTSNKNSNNNKGKQQQLVSGHNNINNAANANSLFTNGLDESMNLFAPINTQLRDEAANNFRQFDFGTPGSDSLATQPKNRSPANVRRIPDPAGAQTFQSLQQNKIDLKHLHVFSPAPFLLDRDPSSLHNPIVSATSSTFLGGIGGNPSSSKPGPITGIAQNLLSSFTKEQLEVLRHQLTVSLFPHEQKPLSSNHVTEDSKLQNIFTDANSVNLNREEFRTFNQNFDPNIQTSPITTSTTTTTATTRKPINFRLKSRERMIRNRHRARNPNSIRLTTTEKPRFVTTSGVPDKPNLFDPFSQADTDVRADSIDSRLRISQNVAAHPKSVPKFSQDKHNAFANLLAVVNDIPETSTEKINIGSVSLGEGGFMSHSDMDVDTVTSHKVNQFEFFTPRPGEAGSQGLSTTMIPAFDEDYSNLVLISSTLPTIRPTLRPRPSVSSSSGPSSVRKFPKLPQRPTIQPIFEAPETTFQFVPTPMTTTIEEDYATNEIIDDDLHVFSFQPTAPPSTPPKKVRFKPTTSRGRQFEFPSEGIENEIQDFTPKFIVDPGMKENFAIVKVKNHNTVEQPRSSLLATTAQAPNTTTTAPIEMTSHRNVITALGARRNRLLNKEKPSFRRRKVKKIKGQRRLKSNERYSETSDILESRQRQRINSKRLPLIRRTSFATSTTTKAAATTNKIFNSGKIPENGINEIVSSNGATKEFQETDPRVLELTNNILELKAKLEQLKIELDV